MTAAVLRRYHMREREDDTGSEVSTLKARSVLRPGSTESNRTNGRLRYVNSATCIENDIFKDDNFDSDSDDANFDDDDQTVSKPPSVTKTCRIDFSPEAEAKRKEAYDKWIISVTAREKERKHVAAKRLEAELEANQLQQASRKKTSEVKVHEWMRKKEIEAEKQKSRLLAIKAAAEAAKKPKEFKNAMNYQDWMAKKNEDLIRVKKQQEEKMKQIEQAKLTHQKCRETVSSISYAKWARSASSKAKPVPLNRGLETLRGSTTKTFINPEPWKFE